MFSILVLLFTVIPALEIYLLFSVGNQIGGINTLIVVITTGIVGAALAKTQGLLILHKIQNELQSGQIPAANFLHGLLVFGGGLLLLTPGFLTDILGLSMVFPGTRHIFALMLYKWFEKAIASGNASFTFTNFSSGSSYSTHSNPFEQTPPQGPRKVDQNTFEADYKKEE